MKQDTKMIFERMLDDMKFFQEPKLQSRPSLFEDCIHLKMPDAWEIMLHEDGTWSWDNTDGG